jgi:hypothetical protein
VLTGENIFITKGAVYFLISLKTNKTKNPKPFNLKRKKKLMNPISRVREGHLL